jgi:dihydroorotate dehydrogenase (fumarate)
MRLPLLWVAVLAGRTRASLAASTGVESSDEVLKYILVGADVVMTTSALLRNGLAHMAALLAGVRSWMAAREVASLDDIRGTLSRERLGATDVFERANYMEILRGYRTRP